MKIDLKISKKVKAKIYTAVISLFFCLYISQAEGLNKHEEYGNYGQIILPATALAISLAYQDKQGVIELAEATLATAIIVYGLKYTIRSQRPNLGSHSFPSGHTASGFVGAAYLQQRYGWRYGLPFYAAATYIGFTRIESKNHWTRDVLAGAGIAIGSNLFITKPFCAAIRPYAQKGEFGFYINTCW